MEKSGFQIFPNQGFPLIVHHWYLLVDGGERTFYSNQIPGDEHVPIDISASRGPILKIFRCNIIYKKNAKRWWNRHLSITIRWKVIKLQRLMGQNRKKRKKEFPPIPVSFHWSVYLAACLFVFLSDFCLSVCLSVHLSICLMSFYRSCKDFMRLPICS